MEFTEYTAKINKIKEEAEAKSCLVGQNYALQKMGNLLNQAKKEKCTKLISNK